MVEIGRRDFFLIRRMLVAFGRLTFRVCRRVESDQRVLSQVAIARGAHASGGSFVVRSGPDLARLTRLAPQERLKCARYLVATWCVYMAVMMGRLPAAGGAPLGSFCIGAIHYSSGWSAWHVTASR